MEYWNGLERTTGHRLTELPPFTAGAVGGGKFSRNPPGAAVLSLTV